MSSKFEKKKQHNVINWISVEFSISHTVMMMYFRDDNMKTNFN